MERIMIYRWYDEEDAMPIGAGKYDDEVTKIMESTGAAGAILIVIGGDKGVGFAIQATLEVTLKLPAMLRNIASQLDDDIPNMKLEA
jgi:hypothetical protein